MALNRTALSWRAIFLGAGTIFATCTAHLFGKSYELYATSVALSFLTALSATALAMSCVICLDISRRKPSSSHTVMTILFQYIITLLIVTIGKRVYSKWKKQTRCIQKVQRDVFFNIMQSNGDTLYGKEYNIKSFTSPEEYIQSHPLTNYAHFEPYIDLLEKGQQNVLSSKKVVFFALTSGTTGKNKKAPILEDYKKRFLLECGSLYLYRGFDHWNVMALKRVLSVRASSPPVPASSGLPRGSISTYVVSWFPNSVIPKCAQLGDIKEREMMYVTAVFGCREREVNIIDAFMAPMGYTFFKVLEENWEQVCDDIERGQLNPQLSIDSETRLELNQLLTPDPLRAKELATEFCKGFEGIAKRIWPLVERISAIRSGSHTNYGKLLEEKYAKGLSIRNSLYLSSEGVFGFSMSDDDSYYLLPQWNFYEFIPAENCEEEQPDTLLMHQLVKGCDYEIVVTNMRGMYRYRQGDIIKVVDFFNQCPIVEFQYRLGQMLNIKNEKTPESVFYEAIRRAEGTWKDVTLIDYTTTESFILEKMLGHSLGNKHYVLFVEVNCEKLTQMEKNKVDESLCELFEVYQAMRKNGSAERMRVVQVKQGAFQELKARLLNGAHNQQFKMPRVLRLEGHLQHLVSQMCEYETLSVRDDNE